MRIAIIITLQKGQLLTKEQAQINQNINYLNEMWSHISRLKPDLNKTITNFDHIEDWSEIYSNNYYSSLMNPNSGITKFQNFRLDQIVPVPDAELSSWNMLYNLSQSLDPWKLTIPGVSGKVAGYFQRYHTNRFNNLFMKLPIISEKYKIKKDSDSNREQKKKNFN